MNKNEETYAVVFFYETMWTQNCELSRSCQIPGFSGLNLFNDKVMLLMLVHCMLVSSMLVS